MYLKAKLLINRHSLRDFPPRSARFLSPAATLPKSRRHFDILRCAGAANFELTNSRRPDERHVCSIPVDKFLANNSTISSSTKSSLHAKLIEAEPRIHDILSASGAPSVSVGVSCYGDIIYQHHEGYRDVVQQLESNLDTVYNIASITKSFTAFGVAILVAEGRLTWDTLLKDILPGFAHSNTPLQQNVTVIDLLAHRTDVVSSNAFWYGFDGELLIHKEETLHWFNNLPLVCPFRSKYVYNNWNYIITGLVIEQVSGMDYGSFLKLHILDPLHLSRTSATADFDDDSNRALPYAVLSDHTAFCLPNPKSRNGTLQGAAQGVQSSTKDLLHYGVAVLQAYRSDRRNAMTDTLASPITDDLSQFASKIAKGWSSLGENSQASGFHLIQLPNRLDNSLGCNPLFVAHMPTINPGPNASVSDVLVQLGSQAGYVSLLVLLPGMHTCFAVQINSIGLGDPASWIVHLLLEILFDTPKSLSNDYSQLAREAASNHANVFIKARQEAEKTCSGEPMRRTLAAYTGRYRLPYIEYFIDVHDRNGKLQISFLGMENQTFWDLEHLEGDVFMMNKDFDELAKRAVFTYWSKERILWRFEEAPSGAMSKVYWKYDADLPTKDQYFVRVV